MPGSVPTTRTTHSPQGRPTEFEDLFGVEDLIVRREQFLKCLLVDLHLGAADPEQPPGSNATSIDPLIGRRDPSIPSGGTALRSMATFRSGREERTDSGRSVTPCSPRGDHDLNPGESVCQRRFIGRGKRGESVAIGLPQHFDGGLGAVESSRAEGDLGPQPAEEPRHTLADPDRCHRGLPPGRGSKLPPAPSRAARTAAAAVVLQPLASKRTETRKFAKKVLVTSFKIASPASDIRPAHEDRRPLELGGTTREQGPIDQVADGIRLNPAMAKQMIHS